MCHLYLLLQWGYILLNKIYKSNVKGSYTIEAALIFPCILFVIISLIYLGFYLHDYGKVQAILYESQTRGKGLIRNEVSMNSGVQSYQDYLDRTIFYPIDNDFKYKQNQISNFINKRCKDKLLISELSNVDVKVSSSNIKLSVGINFQFPFGILKIFFNGSEGVVIENSEKIHNPADFIRGYQVSYDLVKRIDVVNNVTNKLKEVIEGIK